MNTKTQEHLKVEADDEKMNGAQCMSTEDYKKSEAWVGKVKEIIENGCK